MDLVRLPMSPLVTRSSLTDGGGPRSGQAWWMKMSCSNQTHAGWGDRLQPTVEVVYRRPETILKDRLGLPTEFRLRLSGIKIDLEGLA